MSFSCNLLCRRNTQSARLRVYSLWLSPHLQSVSASRSAQRNPETQQQLWKTSLFSMCQCLFYKAAHAGA